MPLTPTLSKSKWPEGADQGIIRFPAPSAIGGAGGYGFRAIVLRTASGSTAAATRTDIRCRDFRRPLALRRRLRRHALGQHDRDDPGIVPVVAYAMRRAQAVPQAVHDLILAQPGRLGDLSDASLTTLRLILTLDLRDI